MYTWNRTDSLKEMTAKEYEACCTALEKLIALHNVPQDVVVKSAISVSLVVRESTQAVEK